MPKRPNTMIALRTGVMSAVNGVLSLDASAAVAVVSAFCAAFARASNSTASMRGSNDPCKPTRSRASSDRTLDEQLPRTHRELGQLIETDLRRQPGRVALTIDAQRFAGRERADLRCTGCERTRVDLGCRIAGTCGREIHGVDRLDGKLAEAQIERLDHGAFGIEPLDREANALEVAQQASGPRVERRLGERARRRR